MTTSEKLEQLCKLEGLSENMLLKRAVMEDVCSGICMNDDCDYVTECEPDASKNYCEECNTHTVTSCLILAGIG